jgi:hypothetical protein
MTPTDPVISVLLSQNAEMRKDIVDTKADIAAIREMMAEQRGQWQGAKGLAAGISTAIAAVAAFINFIVSHKIQSGS